VTHRLEQFGDREAGAQSRRSPIYEKLPAGLFSSRCLPHYTAPYLTAGATPLRERIFSWPEAERRPESMEREAAKETLAEKARCRLAENGPYAHCFRDVTCDSKDGVLTLRGRVESFYLKQVLQTRLRDLEGVTRIENQVEVVSSAGLSSIAGKPR
jgi:hypothetical protein